MSVIMCTKEWTADDKDKSQTQKNEGMRKSGKKEAVEESDER